ncbi:MAG: RNA polymerase sigma factor [Bacteroidales bacterium]|nr:RNA polymerase sigma factor [Bacteroidales bacterium]MCF8387492.1 RNA polymerase sigma factor [Bacteroidales bacterium]MCF8398433.1 RNA polymerase sigma factor [Bacteroidales bacterium]
MSLDKNQAGLEKSNTPKTDALIDKIRSDDRRAQFELYKLYYKAMYNTAYRITGNKAEAEDAMQEAFLDAFRKIGQFDGQSTFGAWLKRIVINKSIDLYKGRKTYVPIENIDVENALQEEEDHLEILSYKISEIRKKIEELPDDYRVIVSLYLLEGYDHEEISNILDISYENARTRYSRARKRLSKELKNTALFHSAN